MASSDRPVTTSIKVRSGRQNQASQITAGKLPIRMACSYTSIACWHRVKVNTVPSSDSRAKPQSKAVRLEK